MILNKYFNNDNALKDKIDKSFKTLIKEYESRRYTDEEFLLLVKEQLDLLINENFNKNFKFREAVYTPVSKDYNDMLKEVIKDLNKSLTNCNMIDSNVDIAFNESDIENSIVYNESSYIYNLLKQLEELINEYSTGNTINIVETFDKDISNLNNNNVEINLEDNTLSLSSKRNEIYKEGINISIVDTNGFPGNTHLIDENKNDITFQGESGVNGNLNNIISQNNPEHFEIELFKVNQEVLDKTNYLGFSYKEDYSWITEDNELYLTIKIIPDKVVELNNIKILPYVNQNSDYIPCLLHKVIITDKGSKVINTKYNIEFDKTLIVNFETQEVREIILYFKQYNCYKCNIAHIYTLKNLSNNIYTNEPVDEIYNRNDFYKPSFNSLGYSLDVKTGELKLPTNDENYTYDENRIQNEILSFPKTDYIYDSYKEIFQAYRYVIGISSIILSNKTFEKEGVYYSNLYEFNNEIEEITLFSNETIKNNQEINYYISFDYGMTWIKIYNKDRSYEGPCTIKVNSYEPVYLRTNDSIYVDRLLSSSSFMLKIEMKAGDSNCMSPIVNNYRLKVKLGSEDID